MPLSTWLALLIAALAASAMLATGSAQTALKIALGAGFVANGIHVFAQQYKGQGVQAYRKLPNGRFLLTVEMACAIFGCYALFTL